MSEATGATPAATTDPNATPATGAAATPAPAQGSTPALPVPDKYEFKLPDGATLPEGFADKAKAAGLTQAQAQAWLDDRIAAGKATIDALKATQEKQFQDTVKAWGEQTSADPEIGGANLEASKATAAKAMAEFGSPEMKAFLEQTGFGSHPVVVKHFVALGKLLDNGRFVKGTGAAGEATPTKDVLYAQSKY